MLTITANKRLAQTLLNQDAQAQLASGKTAWEAAAILPFNQWQHELWDAWVLHACEAGDDPPILLSRLQAKLVWQQMIEQQAQHLSDLLHPALLASQAMNAWKLLHAWRINPLDTHFEQGTPEHQQFAQWAISFANHCRHNQWCDEAQLLSYLIDWIQTGAADSILPKQIKLVGFVQMTTQDHLFWQTIAQRHVDVQGMISSANVLPDPESALSFATIEDEQEAIGAWVVQQLRDRPDARLVVALPRMRAWRDDLVEKILFSTATHSLLPTYLDAPPPINLSLGDPLGQQPIVAIVRLLLGVRLQEIEHRTLLLLLSSPFIAGTANDLRFGQWLSEANIARWSWFSLIERVKRELSHLSAVVEGQGRVSDQHRQKYDALTQGLTRLTQWQPPKTRHDHNDPSFWVDWMQQRLQCVGLSTHHLGSLAYQAWAAFEAQLDQLRTLNLVSQAISLDKVLSLLDGLLGDPWQPRQSNAQVQLLGMMEAAGVDCDALWIADMGLEQWPPDTAPNPFIPIPLQRAAGVRDVDAAKQADYARQIFGSVVENAASFVVSVARSDGNRVDLLPTGLFSVKWQHIDSIERLATRWMTHQSSGAWQDWNAPMMTEQALVQGGTKLFTYQSRCPFSAFSQLRLYAKMVRLATESPDAALRGILVHNSLEAVWRKLKTTHQLTLQSDESLQLMILDKVTLVLQAAQARAPSLLGNRYFALELARICTLVWDVLAHDRRLLLAPYNLPHFDVESEANLQRSVCGVAIHLRIDRLQAFEVISARRPLWIVDYKTGRVSPKDWESLRPWDPQLPVYVLALKDEHDIAGVAFYSLKDRPQLLGLSRDDVPLSDYQDSLSASAWKAHIEDWQSCLQHLSDDFKSGVATADPLTSTQKNACDYCHLALLCRKHEWSGEILIAKA